MMIPNQRHLFDIPADVAYLNCAYMAPLLRAVVSAGEEGVRRKARPWDITPRDFFPQAERARELFAGLIHASASDVALIPSASYGIATAAKNLELRSGQRIVVLAEEFPSNVYAWREHAAASGAEVAVVPRPADSNWTRMALESIDRRSAIVALSQCHWTDGGCLDLAIIGERCREVRAALVLDLTQSAGAMPFDVTRVQPDFAVSATYKWLLGPYSMGFLYVAPARRAARPLEHNWIARRGSENFAALVEYNDEFQPGACRFDVGERSNFALLPMVIAALEQLGEWGIESIAETLRARTAQIAHRAHDLGLRSVPDEHRAGHFLGLRFPRGLPADLLETLVAHRVYVSVRGDSMRVTPHLYNDDHDVERLFEALRRSTWR
jgi:selenocysteine lyase/cysteine desulfurase